MNKNIKTDQVYRLDQFFTRKEIAQSCLDQVKSLYNLDDFRSIIEPSAGQGSFFNILPFSKRIGIEIDEELCNQCIEYQHLSFFDYEPYNNDKILVIGLINNT